MESWTPDFTPAVVETATASVLAYARSVKLVHVDEVLLGQIAGTTYE
jgi:hypothetical protein